MSVIMLYLNPLWCVWVGLQLQQQQAEDRDPKEEQLCWMRECMWNVSAMHFTAHVELIRKHYNTNGECRWNIH